MTSQWKLERDLLHADMAAVTALLDGLDPEDVMMRFSLEARRDELLELIEEAGAEPDDIAASAVLFFGGQPVTGTRGIESDFAGEAVSKFQDLVAKVMAKELGALSERGVVPNKRAAVLHITNITRGSFGFVLEEVRPQGLPMDSPLKSAVSEATKLLDAFGHPSDAQYEEAVEKADPRILDTARDFFRLMRQRSATLRLVTNEWECRLGVDGVTRAAERAKSTATKSTEESIRGQLVGVLPDARRFEFRTDDSRRVIDGGFGKSFGKDALIRFSEEWIGIDVQVQMTVRRVFRRRVLVRESYMLMGLQESNDG